MTWWRRLFNRAALETELEKEIRFHLEQSVADLVADGWSAEEARRHVLLGLGGAEQMKEECRDARGTRWAEELFQDIRYALRALRQKPAFGVLTISTLALGIGATTVMFTVIDGVLLKPLPYRDPGRLLRLREFTDRATPWGNVWSFAYPNFLDCQRQSRTLDMAAWRDGSGVVSRPGTPEYIEGVQVSSTLFSVLNVEPYRGRAFLPTENRPGSARVAIISHEFWLRRFGGDARTVGSPLVFEGATYTIVGITPPGFRLIGNQEDVMTPIGQDADPILEDRDRHPGIQVLARLRPGATSPQAQAELALIAEHLAREFPKTNTGRSFPGAPLRIEVGDDRLTLLVLLSAVGLVLLIACVNVASLLLSRAVSREREFAMRMALGASRWRLMRQTLTESALLGVIGGAFGIVLAAVGVHPFVSFWPGGLPRAEDVSFNVRSLGFAFGISLASGLLFGLTPALRVRANGIELALRAGGRTVTGGARRLHKIFVISEIGLALVLLGCAGMLGRALLRLSSLDPGMNVRNILTARVELTPAILSNAAAARSAWQSVLDRATRVPGVRSATIVDTVPMREGNNLMGYWTTLPEPPQDQQKLVSATSVTPDYLNVTGLSLRAGRFITAQDRQGSEAVVVIDDVMARQAFGSEDAIGKHLWIDMRAEPARVVGLVGHVRYWGPADDDQAKVRAELYYPFAQVPDHFLKRWSELMSVAIRTEVPPLGVVDPLRRAMQGAPGDPVLYEVRDMDHLASDMLAHQKFLLLLFGVFATLSLLLSCTGVFGVMAYLTGQRVAEFGLRMALGATAGNVMRLVLRESLTMVLSGIAIGVAAAFLAARVLLRVVEGTQPAEAWTFALMVPVLVTAALFAGFIPAHRASRIDPTQALRQD